MPVSVCVFMCVRVLCVCVSSRSLSESLSATPSFQVSSLRRPHPPLPLSLHCSCSITLFTSAPLSCIFSTLSSPSSLSSPRLVSPLLLRHLFSPKKKKNQTCPFCLGVLSASSWSDDLPPAPSRKSHLACNLAQVE